MRRLFWLVLAVTPVAGLAGGCDGPKPPPDGSIEVREASCGELERALGGHKGKVVVVDFWATWCGPCVKKFPHLVELHKKHAADGLVCVSVSLNQRDEKREVLRFLQERDAAFPNYLLVLGGDDDARVARFFGYNGSIPFVAVFDKSGKKVSDSGQKRLTDAELDKLVETELAR
jgi:thiol-disulfide isomerase/thioredoxin